MKIIGYVILILYALLSLFASILGRKQTKNYASILMSAGAIIAIVSVVLCLVGEFLLSMILMILGLLLIQAASIFNGYILYKKFDPIHQLIRLALEGLIVLFVMLL